MKVTATRTLIYDAQLFKAGEVFEIDVADVAKYEARGWIKSPSNQAPSVQTLTELPPLDAPRKKK